MSSGKFNAWSSTSMYTIANITYKHHNEPGDLILNGLVNDQNIMIHLDADRCAIPKELVYKLRPLQKVYRIKQDLSWTEFTNHNRDLEKYVSMSNPCCQVDKISDFQLALSNFDEISKAFISNGEINNKLIGLYLSATYAGHSVSYRNGTIFMPDSPIVKNYDPKLKLTLGIAQFKCISGGSPYFHFTITENLGLWNTCPSYR